MKIEKFHIYLADLNPRVGTEPGKIRPVMVIQTNLLNNTHPSTIVCPLTTNIIPEATLLRVHIPKKEAGLEKDSDILVDQIRAIDNLRFKKHLGKLSLNHQRKILDNLQVLLFE